MSEIHQDVCPIMSRSVTFASSQWEEDGIDCETREDYLIEIPCLGSRCKWYMSNDGECCIKNQAMSIDAIFERME